MSSERVTGSLTPHGRRTVRTPSGLTHQRREELCFVGRAPLMDGVRGL